MAELNPTQLAYVQWRADPERSGNKREWAKEHEISEGTLRRWDHEPWFRDALDRRLQELNVSPERMQVVLDALFREAKGGDTAAAKAYFQWIEQIMPKRVRIEDATIESLTDEELEAAFRDGLASRAST
jgi:hypothetical protein